MPTLKQTRRIAYEVVREVGGRSITIGFKCRLLSRNRANRISRWLKRRGHDVRMRCFGNGGERSREHQ